MEAVKIGDVVKYKGTGTVGRVISVVRDEMGGLWAELDTTGLLYSAEYLEPSSEEELKRVLELKERRKRKEEKVKAEVELKPRRSLEEEGAEELLDREMYDSGCVG